MLFYAVEVRGENDIKLVERKENTMFEHGNSSMTYRIEKS